MKIDHSDFSVEVNFGKLINYSLFINNLKQIGL